MASEFDTSESLTVQARDEKDVDRRNKQCNITTANQKKENISFEYEPNTDGTKGDEPAKQNFIATEGNNFDTDGECSSVEKVTNDDCVEQSEDCPEATLDDTENTIQRSDKQQQATKTAKEAEEQPTESPAPDAKAKEISEGTICCNEELKKEPYNEDEVSGAEKDQKGIPEIDGYKDHTDNFSSLENETVEHPRNPAASSAVFEASVSETHSVEKASTAVVPRPEIMAEVEKENTQKDEDKKMECSDKEDFNMSETSNFTIEKEESRPEIMKGLHEASTSPWENTDTVEEQKRLHEAGSDCNVEGESKSLCEKDFDEMTGTSNTLKNKIEPAYKKIESIAESQGKEICRDNGANIEEDTFSSSNESGPLQTAMVKSEQSEECTVEEMMLEEQKETKLLNEAFRLSSENHGSDEPIERITSSNPCETNSWIDNSKAKIVEIHTSGIVNSDMADIHQEIKTKANLEVPADFTESIISSNDDDLCHGDNPIAKEERCGKQDVGFESQPEDKQESKEKKLYEQVSEARINTEFTSSDRKSDANAEKKIAGQTTSITEEEKTPDMLEFEPERQEIQNQGELPESKPKQQAPDSTLQESRIGSTDKISSLMESTDKDIVNDERHLEMYNDDVTAKETVIREVPSANMPEEISKEPYKLPNQQNDQSALDGSKLTNEAIFSVISREQNPQQEDQLNKSNDVTIGKADQAQENYDNSDTTELDLSESNIDIQKDSKSRQESRSDKTNGAHIAQDIDKNNNQIEEGNNDQVHDNQRYLSDIEAQGLHGNMNDAIGMCSTSATLSFDSNKITEGKDALTEIETHNQENEDANTESNIALAKEENYDKDQAGCNTKTEILDAEDSERKIKGADEVETEPTYNEEAQCIKEQASEDDVLNVMMKKEADDKEFEITKSYPLQLHDDSSMQLLKVEAHERCELDEVRELEELENTRSEESRLDKAKENQESIEIYQRKNEIVHDGLQVTEAESTTAAQLQDPEDGALYNSNIDVSAKEETYTISDSIEEQKDGKTHAQTAFMEIRETRVNKGETRDEGTEETQESATYFGIQDQQINEESASVMTKKEQYHEESDDPSNAKGAVSSYDIKRDDSAEENWNHPNILEVLEQDINAKSDSIEVLQDVKTHQQIGFDQITEHSFTESDSCCVIPKQETAEACTPTPLINVDQTILSKDECTNIASENINIQDSETQEDEERDKQVDDLERTKMGLNAHKSTGDGTLPNNENSINIWKEDIQAQISSIEMQKEEKINEQTCSYESYVTTMVKKENWNLMSEESGSYSSSNDGQVIAQASTPFREVENPVLSKDIYTRSSSADFQRSEIKEETATEEQHSGVEDPDIITDNGSSYKDIKTMPRSIEDLKDERTNEEAYLNETYKTQAVENEEIVNQSFEDSNSCIVNGDQGTSQVSPLPLVGGASSAYRDECTRIYSTESDDSEKKGDEEASFGKEQCISKMEDPRNINTGVCSYGILRVESLISENSMNTVEDVHQDTKAHSYPMEAQHENTCNQMQNIEAVNRKESMNQFSKVSDYAEAEISVTEAEIIVPNKEDHTVIPCENEVLKLKEEAMVESQQFDAEEQNKMTDGVCSNEDKGIGIEQENEYSAHMIDKNQAIIAALEKSKVQIDFSEAHETKVVNCKEIDGQSSEERNPCSVIQDQEIAEATTQLLEADGPLPNINKGTGISREGFDVSELQNEPVIQDSNETNATPICQIEDEEIMPGTQDSVTIVEDMIQEFNKSDNFELQKKEKAREQMESSETNNEEINNECTKDSNSYIGKQDKKILESSRPLEAEIQVARKDECAECSIDRIQLNEVEDKAAKEQQQCYSETENLNKITNSAYQFENIEPAAMKEMLTLDLREENNARNDAIDKSIKNHAGNDNMEKEKDVHQSDKENPGTEIESKDYNVEQAIAREEAHDEAVNEINIYDKEIIEGIEMPKLSKSTEIEGSLSSTENEVRNDAIQMDDNNNIIPNQQTVIGTETSEEYASIGMCNLDSGQSAKKFNVHTQTGFDAEGLKLENKGPESINNSLEEEVKENYYSNEGDKSSGQNYMNPVCAMVEQGEQGASNVEEISVVQTLVPESGLVKETIDEEDKQGIDSDENKLSGEIMTLVKETTCSQEPLLERNAVKEVSLTEQPQQAGDKKESPPKVDDLSNCIITGKEDENIQLTEPDQVSRDISLKHLYEKLSVEDQELDHTKNEEKVRKAMVPSKYCQEVNETIAEETIREEIWQANEQDEKLQESSSEHHGQKHWDTRMEDEDKRTSTTEVPREEKSHEFSTSQKTYLSEEEKKHGESNSDFLQNLDSELKQLEDNVTTDELAMTEPQDLSSDFQSANSISESETRPEYTVDKDSCSQETRNDDVIKLLQKSEQINDISGQHDSSPKPISENKIVQGQCESFEQMTKQYVQEGMNSEEFDQKTHENTVNRELILDANQSNEEQKEQKIAICDLISTEVTAEANIISDDSKIYESDATKECCQEASSAEETDYKVNSRDTMDNASGKTGGKNANIQDDGQVQKPENQFELTESDKIDESSSQNTLLQGDNEALGISTTVETQQTNTEKFFAQDAKDNTNKSECAEDSRDVSAREIKANFSTEKELNDAERDVKFPNLTAVHMNVQDVKGSLTSCRFQANETEEPHKTLSGKHLEEIYGTTKPFHEIEEKENETSSEKPVHETHLPELEQRECEVLSSKDEPIKDSTLNQALAENGQTVIESIVEPEDSSSLEFGVIGSTSEEKSWTEPISNLDGFSQVIENENKWQDSKISEENTNDPTECSQQISEPLGEEQTDSDETHQEMCQQLKNSHLIAEDKSLADFGAHETTGNENKHDKNTVLHTDPTLAQQNMSFGKEEMTVMVENQETSTENNKSSVEGEAVVIATRQQLAEHTVPEELCQFQYTKEDDNPHIQSIAAEKEQEVEEKHESLPVSSQFQDRFKNVSMEKTSEELGEDIVASGDKRQQQDDGREESEEQNKNEAWTQKGASVTESEINGFSLLQPSDPVKESLKEGTTDNFSVVKNETGEHEHHDESLETQVGLNTLNSAIPLSTNIKQESSPQTSLSSNVEQEQGSLHNQPKHEGETALAKSKFDEEKQDEQEDSGLKVPLMSEAPRDMELKATHKKSLNILSEVGSKVKNSISKVKKAMACTTSQFTTEEVIIKLNKNKKLDKA